MSKFTKGPWIANLGAAVVTTVDGSPVCLVARGSRMTHDQAESNTQAISALPDLIEALAFMVSTFENNCHTPQQDLAIFEARAAIAKGDPQ